MIVSENEKKGDEIYLNLFLKMILLSFQKSNE